MYIDIVLNRNSPPAILRLSGVVARRRRIFVPQGRVAAATLLAALAVASGLLNAPR